ncbi:hypothetical protein [Bradyrhizobium icense]|uniref:hypothetical protein n=1 Tax=Bradyrhizobium icense TaxID=1274631 RepID=UPI0012EAC250|nr:hypothetical protein [Bradyrhizobium icense]
MLLNKERPRHLKSQNDGALGAFSPFHEGYLLLADITIDGRSRSGVSSRFSSREFFILEDFSTGSTSMKACIRSTARRACAAAAILFSGVLHGLRQFPELLPLPGISVIEAKSP